MKTSRFLVSLTLLFLGVGILIELDTLNENFSAFNLTQLRIQKIAQKRLELGKIYESKGSYELAYQTFEKATESLAGPAQKTAINGMVRNQIQHLTNHLKDINQSELEALKLKVEHETSLDPFWRDALEYLGASKKSDEPKLLALAQKLKTDTRCPPGLISRIGKLLLEQNQIKDALDLLEPAVGRYPHFADLWLRLGEAHRKNGDLTKAVEAYEQALKVERNSMSILAIARILMQQNKWADALARLNENETWGPLENEALKLKAACQFQLKNYQVAARLYEEAFQLRGDPKTLMSKVITRQRANQHELALRDLEMLLRHDDQLPEVYFQRGQSLVGVGKTYEAAQSFVKFLKMTEGHANQENRRGQASNWLRAYQRSLVVPDELKASSLPNQDQNRSK